MKKDDEIIRAWARVVQMKLRGMAGDSILINVDEFLASQDISKGELTTALKMFLKFGENEEDSDRCEFTRDLPTRE